ncbi:hypothetical protein MAPG_05148 [Magnaporthiopsis poae ATCC 64411]|uniref:Glycoside hydrolase n=1 Tax=Magnaporthiopsis poae (strain ATCC 64411 / 73-15) TaxID=644358 RepID=A0A0C4DYM2_MAGP6|nr:hypothetical protein MAPG_05148 [Magnaporthiopsis poae ATCC 64411]
MAVQLREEALGTAVGVLIFSFVCLFSGLLMIVLVWVQHERTSYIACLSFLTTICTLASIIQQFHSIIDWRDIMLAKFERILADPQDPELIISGAAEGFDLILFYIQFYSYNAMAMMTLFWAFELAASVFKWRDPRGKRTSLYYKATAFTLPAIIMGILRLRAVLLSRTLYSLLANIIIAVSLSTVVVVLLVILSKYIRTRMAFLSWHVGYGGISSPMPEADNPDHALCAAIVPRQSIHDSWLMVRFTIASLVLAIFEVWNFYFDKWASAANAKALADGPDFSVQTANENFLSFMPGASASLLVFVIFGTTKPLRAYMWSKVVPRRIRERQEANRGRPPSVVFPRGEGGGVGDAVDEHQLSMLSHGGRDGVRNDDGHGYGYDEGLHTGGRYPHLPPISSGGDISDLSGDLERIISKSSVTDDMVTKPPSVVVHGGRTNRGSRRMSNR